MMADIDVVPRRRNLIWFWILLAIIAIALLAWALMARPGPMTELQPIHSGIAFITQPVHVLDSIRA